MNDKIKAIVAHLTVIGWIVSVVMNLVGEKTPLTQFYLRQMFGLLLMFFVVSLFPGFLGKLLVILVIGLWVFSLIGAVQEKRNEIPYIGNYFQQWFKFL